MLAEKDPIKSSEQALGLADPPKKKSRGVSAERMREIGRRTRFGAEKASNRELSIAEIAFQKLENCILRGPGWQSEYTNYFQGQRDTLEVLNLKKKLLRTALKTEGCLGAKTTRWALSALKMVEILISQGGWKPIIEAAPAPARPYRFAPTPVPAVKRPTAQEIAAKAAAEKVREQKARLDASAFKTQEDWDRYRKGKAEFFTVAYMLPSKQIVDARITLMGPELFPDSRVIIRIKPRPSETAILVEHNNYLSWAEPQSAKLDPPEPNDRDRWAALNLVSPNKWEQKSGTRDGTGRGRF